MREERNWAGNETAWLEVEGGNGRSEGSKESLRHDEVEVESIRLL